MLSWLVPLVLAVSEYAVSVPVSAGTALGKVELGAADGAYGGICGRGQGEVARRGGVGGMA